MLYYSEYQFKKYLSAMLCQNSSTKENDTMKIIKNFSDFVYFIFPFTNGLKKLLHFLHFELMITLLVTSLSLILVNFLILVKV